MSSSANIRDRIERIQAINNIKNLKFKYWNACDSKKPTDILEPSYIVIDEYIGQSIAILFCEQNILEFVSAFFLFRFFDIIKPFPINYFDKQNTSFGLLMDDITAGLIAGIITFFLFKI